MSLIHAFKGWRPQREDIKKISCLPYDVISREEAAAQAKDNDSCFYRIIRPEIDLPQSAAAEDKVYEQARKNFIEFKEKKYLVEDPQESFYLYQQKMGDHVQTGLFVGASCQEYLDGKIKKHEFTLEVKEEDRANLIERQQASADPVFLMYRDREDIRSFIETIDRGQAVYDFNSEDNIGHTLWKISGTDDVKKLKELFSNLNELYIADGHHRCAASARYYQRKTQMAPSTGSEPWNYFLAVLYPDTQLKILDYNRVVKNLAGLSSTSFLEKLSEKFHLSDWEKKVPQNKHSFAMFLNNTWQLLTAKKEIIPENDILNSLDVAILQNEVLSPLLNIEDPRKNDNIKFIGGIRGLDELEKYCQKDFAVAFALYPTSLDELFRVADECKIMPPKSTWFEPKIRSGLVVLSLE